MVVSHRRRAVCSGQELLGGGDWTPGISDLSDVVHCYAGCKAYASPSSTLSHLVLTIAKTFHQEESVALSSSRKCITKVGLRTTVRKLAMNQRCAMELVMGKAFKIAQVQGGFGWWGCCM